ncbi:ABC transporter ATP-binding protein [Verminephrobacter sp. Larva24]|nr:ABC transporter ATP-binding protein [Verminephrobacter sp. Larva24]
MDGIQITGLDKRYGAVEVIRNFNLEIGRGEFFVFLGPSGCGKSTLRSARERFTPATQNTDAPGRDDQRRSWLVVWPPIMLRCMFSAGMPNMACMARAS